MISESDLNYASAQQEHGDYADKAEKRRVMNIKFDTGRKRRGDDSPKLRWVLAVFVLLG